MKILHKHLLPFDNAFAFYTEALEGTNAFSEEVLSVISRETGQFFTLLPDNANLAQLCHFSEGILPEESKKKGKVGNLTGTHTYSLIPSLEPEFADFLYKQMQMHAYQFMSDDYNASYKEMKNKEWFNLYGMHYLEEIYYCLSPQNATPQLIEQCLSRSKTFWHSLSVLSEKSVLSNEERTLERQDIQTFCKFIRFSLVGAYDGEGYVVWEKE